MHVTRYVRRESQDPNRTEPDRTGPTALMAGSQDQCSLRLGRARVIGLEDETNSIRHLDFEPRCDGREGECPNPADYLARHHCPVCGREEPGRVRYACDPCWVGRSRRRARCRECRAVHPHGDAWRIVTVLR